MSHRRRARLPDLHAPEAGQGLVEFALVFPLFMLMMLFIIEFAFVFSALLGVNYASRNGALIAAEAGRDTAADCVILQTVENSIGAPGNKANIQTVTIYRSDQSGSTRLQTLTYTRGGSMTCAGSTLSPPYTKTGGTYTYDQRCNELPNASGYATGTPCQGLGRTQIDTIGIEITYRHSWVTPIRNFGLAGTGATFTQSNAMRMEPIL